MLLALLAVCGNAAAYWNADWAFRKKITINTSDTGAGIKQNVGPVALAVRLHTGNFGFLDAKEDGSDIRFVAADDKTPLKHHVESFDATNELAIIWVQVPKLSGAANAEYFWIYYGNKKAAKADDAPGTYDPNQSVVLHFAGEIPQDSSPQAQKLSASGVKTGVPGLLGPGASFEGGAIAAAGPASLKVTASGGFTFSAWVKPENPTGTLYAQQEGSRALVVGLEGGRAYARFGAASVQAPAGSELKPGAWRHVAATLGANRLAIYVDGAEVASGAVSLADIGGNVTIGSGPGGAFRGVLDEVQLSTVARPAEWVKLTFANQGQDAKLLRFGDDEQGSSGGHSYLGILVDNLTVDAWVVIGILGVMLVVSFAVMIAKALFLSRTQQANDRFLERFEDISSTLTEVDRAGVDGAADARSSLNRIYAVAMRELQRRFHKHADPDRAFNLSPQALDAIRATIDADMVREVNRLNSKMVLLTIAISGGPFLGLLGTVVGVMITFAAIAAAGDVNINAIAPGIAAALLATVAGLAVAIPCLFGYNYLASRIKSITSGMQVFADELITKLAESYST